MPRQRINISGQIYFITTRTFNNQRIFKNSEYCQILLKNLDYYRSKLKFKLLAHCLLPDHLHLLILPDEEFDISKIMQLIKYRTASDVRKLCSREPGSRLRKTNIIWQKSFYDKAIRSEKELYNVINYINYNAVKHHLVENLKDWPYSSIHNYEEISQKLVKIDNL